MFKVAKLELVHEDFAQIELKDTITETERNVERTGNGNTANGSGQNRY